MSIKLFSLNAQGLRDYVKRKKVFKYLQDKKADILFIQETHSTKEIETFWQCQMKGQFYFSHGSNKSKGVLIFIRSGFVFDLIDSVIDKDGRYIILHMLINEKSFVIANIYAPNRIQEQIEFWLMIQRELEKYDASSTCFVLGGDFNVSLNPRLDKISKIQDGALPTNSSRSHLLSLLGSLDLYDVWRFVYPQVKQYTWRTRDLKSHSRLDYWFVPYDYQDYVSEVSIVPSISSDHSAISLNLAFKNLKTGKGYWKFNSSFCLDSVFCDSLKREFLIWEEECKDFDPKARWEFLKFKIRRLCQTYGKKKAKENNARRIELERKVKLFEANITDGNTNQIRDYEMAKTELEDYYNKLTDGLIIRSKADWSEYGERSNKYFLSLEKHHRSRSVISKLKINNEVVETEEGVLKEIKDFYQSLYTKENVELNNDNAKSFLNSNMNHLTEASQELCEGILSKEECWAALKDMPSGKSPGNDGLTKEFYTVFWELICEPLITSLNYSHKNLELSPSQKQSVITLILKPHKDKMNLQNYRPISLLNVDVKICSKALAARVKKVIDEIIHNDQHAFIKGRSIGEAIRNVHDIFYFLKKEDRNGIIVSIDFHKAFDSIDHEFLYHALKTVGFGQSFVRWVKTLYSHIESCVLNNGASTGYFPVSRGVRQGDPLSPYLFIIAIEFLANKIRMSNCLKGINIGRQEFKLSLYADDCCVFCPDEQSVLNLFCILEKFYQCSSLKFNKEKTEVLKIGYKEEKFALENEVRFVENIKVLGTYIGHAEETLQENVFRELLLSLTRQLNLWKIRNLSLFGKIQILKSFGISKFIYLFSSILMPDWVVKEMETLFFNFLWNGKDRIRRNVMIQTVESGGLKMIDIRSAIAAQQLCWVLRIKDENNQIWCNVLRHYTKDYGGLFIFNCNYNTELLNVPPFYKSVLEKWITFRANFKDASIINQVLWNNSDIKIDQKPFFCKSLFGKGVVTANQILKPDKNVKEYEVLHNDFEVTANEYLILLGVYSSIRKISDFRVEQVGDDIIEKLGNMVLLPQDLGFQDKIKSKKIYEKLVEFKGEGPLSSFRLKQRYDLNDKEISKARVLMFKITIDMKMREFHFKIINNILYFNFRLHKMRLKPSPICTLCGELDTMEHALWKCCFTQKFWSEVKLTMFMLDLSNLDEKAVITGFQCNHPQKIIINYVLLIAKRCIYISWVKETQAEIQVFKNMLFKAFKEESYISKRKNKISFHNKKWDCIKPLFN